MSDTNIKVHYSSASNEWETPREFFDELAQIFNFTLDPCATPLTAKCEKYYTMEDNGLSKDWGGETVFMNPPYGRDIPKWVKKAYDESRKENTTVVCLIPSRTDTIYWHQYCMKAFEICFVKGRIKFGNNSQKDGNSAPFPSAVVIFKSDKDDDKSSYPRINAINNRGKKCYM